MIDLANVVRSAAAYGSVGAAFATGLAAAAVNRDRRSGVNLAAALGGDLSLAAAGVHLAVQGE